MTELKFSATSTKLPEIPSEEKQIVILGVRKSENQYELVSNFPEATQETSLVSDLLTQVELLGADTSLNSVTKLAAKDFTQTVFYLVGLGTDEELENLRQASGAAIRAARGEQNVVITLPNSTTAELEAIAEGALLGAYDFTKFRSEAKAETAQIEIRSDLPEAADVLSRAAVLVAAVNTVRDLTNLPANHLNPELFAALAEKEAEAHGVTYREYKGTELVAEKLSGLLAVGAGSATPPRLVRLEWNPAEAKTHIALVGKGITFDTGGYSLKPASSITEMKTDMCGAATVFQTVIAAAQLGLPVKVTGWLCLAENMVSGTASRPDDVITYRNGKSVEINNTDAEGRLVMADGLIMASEEKPDVVIDIATLTGAQMVALGERVTGIMGDDAVRDDLIAAATATAELAWGMPLPEHLKDGLKSDIADLKNTGSRWGGMLSAGIFLSEFVADTPWAHIDIAGPSFNRHGAYGHTPKGATGVMLRTLIQYLEERIAE